MEEAGFTSVVMSVNLMMSDNPGAWDMPDSASTGDHHPQHPPLRSKASGTTPAHSAAAQPRALLLPLTAAFSLYHFCMLLLWLAPAHGSSGTSSAYLTLALFEVITVGLTLDNVHAILTRRFTDAQLKDRYLLLVAGFAPTFQVLLTLLHPPFTATEKNWAAVLAFAMCVGVSICSFPPAHALVTWTTMTTTCIALHCYCQHLKQPGSAWDVCASALTQGPVIAGAGLVSWLTAQVFVVKSSMQLSSQAEGMSMQDQPLGSGSTEPASSSAASKQRQAEESGSRLVEEAGEKLPSRHSALQSTPLPFETWGVRLPPAAAAMLRTLESLLLQLADHVNEELLVRLVCLPLMFYSLLLCLLARVQFQGLSYFDVSHDMVLIYMFAWFMVGRNSSNFEIGPLVLKIQAVASAAFARAPHQPSLLELVDRLRQHVTGGARPGAAPGSEHHITVTELLGEGAFGKVYKGVWRGTLVAVKRVVLPGDVMKSERRERMAIMEAAISGALVHPNIVQTYTYTVQSVQGGSTAPREVHVGDTLEHVPGMHASSASPTTSSAAEALEVQLVLEYMDCGTLRDVLDDGCFELEPPSDEDGPWVNYYAVLETAADVAKGMLHLHSLNVIHCDLKARNVLLRSCASDPRSFTAKVGDFGLSLKLDSGQACVDACFHGTPTHMAPEVHALGRQSKAADVYSFGITLWELYTGERAFQDVCRALLPQHIAEQGNHLRFPPNTPHAYAALAARCWDQDPQARPRFEEVVDRLLELIPAESGDMAPVPVTVLGAQVTVFRPLQDAPMVLNQDHIPGPGLPGQGL